MTSPQRIVAAILLLSLAFIITCSDHDAWTEHVEFSRASDADRTVARSRIDDVMALAVQKAHAPGAVLRINQGGRRTTTSVVGARSLTPEIEPMTADTVFDLASLTKVVATTTLVLQAIDAGRLSMSTRVAEILPEFAENGKEAVTIEDLLRHRGGLVADNAMDDYRHGPEEARRRTLATKPTAPRDTEYVYSDVGFIVLGWVVEKIHGRPFDQCAHDEVFSPLDMRDTMFRPLENGMPIERIAPTEPESPDSAPLRGVVHDPRARALGGVAGHAGLFSTADDLSKFCAMIHRRGKTVDGRVIVSESSVAKMGDPGRTIGASRRGAGWDMRAPDHWATRPGGRYFGLSGFGHTGFTGTSIWIDPVSATSLILLTSRLHPTGKGDVTRLRRTVADLAADYLETCGIEIRPSAFAEELPRIFDAAPDLSRAVKTGLDRVDAGEWPERFRNRRVGLITNHTGKTGGGKTAIDVLVARKDLKLTTLFSPEHGFLGKLDAEVADTVDKKTGLPVFSLYGKTRRPTPEMLDNVDLLVFDIQDIGTRFYTYISTMVYAMEEAAKLKKAFLVLDRPNPIGGEVFEGPIADADRLDFVGCLRIPIRHAMTVGEIAKFAKTELALDLDLEVVPMTGWRRDMLYSETDLPWIDPSPNMRTLEAALLYPGIGILETTNVSVGRGTDRPFEILGAPWLDTETFAEALYHEGIDIIPNPRAGDPSITSVVMLGPTDGIHLRATTFRPTSSTFKGELCNGFEIVFDSSPTISHASGTVELGLTIARLLREQFPNSWKSERYPVLLKNAGVMTAVTAPDRTIWNARPRPAVVDPDFADFMRRRAAVLMYR